MVPNGISKTIEPFAGSACFTFQQAARHAVISDINSHLIDFYSQVRECHNVVFETYSRIPVRKEKYYEIRKEYNKEPPSPYRAGRFLYLNRYCFNGIYRVNKSGQFNVPWGGTKEGKAITRDELAAVSQRLRHISIHEGDFQSIVENHLTRGSLVYLDPPYARDEKRVFREYYSNSFVTGDWERLAVLLHEIDDFGAKFILTYAGDASLISKLRKWQVGYLDVTRNIGGFKSTRRKHREFIASNI